MSNSLKNSDERYDSSYERELSVTYFGLFCLFVCIILTLELNDPHNYYINNSNNYFGKAMAFLLLLRIFVPIGLVRIAKRQNRNPLLWGLISFIFPILAMIIIGQLKKLYIPVIIDANKTNIENSKILLGKSLKYYEQDKLVESKRFCLKAFELDGTNIDILKHMRRFGL